MMNNNFMHKFGINSGVFAVDGAGGGVTDTNAAAPQASASPSVPVGATAAAVVPSSPEGTAAAPIADYWPEGLDQQFKGADHKASLDNLGKALQGYRSRDAARDVPDKPEGYYNFEGLKDFKIEPANKPYFDMLPKDPAFKPMAAAALKHGVSRSAVLDIYQSGLSAMAEQGLLEPMIDPVKEKAALIPEAAQSLAPAAQEQAVQRRMQENYDFLQLAGETLGLDKESGKYAELMLGDTAKGHRFFEWMRSKIQGSGGSTAPRALPGGASGDSRESLRKAMAELKPGTPNYSTEHAALTERYKALYGE